MTDLGKLNDLIGQMAERRRQFYDVHNFGDAGHWNEADELMLIGLVGLQQRLQQQESRLTKKEKNDNGEAELERDVIVWSGATAFQEALEKLWQFENVEEGIKNHEEI